MPTQDTPQNKPQIPEKLPEFLHKYFWDTDAAKLNPRDAQKYVINRLLNRGSIDALKWLFQNFPKEVMIEVVKNSRDWFKRSVNFWTYYFNINRDEVICLNKQFQARRNSFWPY